MRYLIIAVLFTGCSFTSEARYERDMERDLDKKSLLIQELANTLQDCGDSLIIEYELRKELERKIWQRDSLINELKIYWKE